MPGFATYDPKQVQVILDGNPITGFADGTFVEIEFDEQAWNKVTGADNLVSRSKTNNYAGTVTVTLLATSSGNDVLNALWQRDRRSNTGAVPFLVKDATGRTVWSAEHAWVQQQPAQAFSKETEERAWTLDCAELFGNTGGNQPIVI
jgi:hypothetical protein